VDWTPGGRWNVTVKSVLRRRTQNQSTLAQRLRWRSSRRPNRAVGLRHTPDVHVHGTALARLDGHRAQYDRESGAAALVFSLGGIDASAVDVRRDGRHVKCAYRHSDIDEIDGMRAGLIHEVESIFEG